MVEHVYQRAVASGADRVVVATDDERILQAVAGFGGEGLLTGEHHRSGTERLAEVVERLGLAEDAVVVNLQGDEPQMPSGLVEQVAKDLIAHPVAALATLGSPLTDPRLLFEPHVVKVVRDQEGYALYFSRAAIPWDRDGFSEGRGTPSDHYRHIGLYAYRVGFIQAYTQLSPCSLEQIESLEQLRALYYGYRIHVAVAEEAPGQGVDTAADLARVRAALGDEEASQ